MKSLIQINVEIDFRGEDKSSRVVFKLGTMQKFLNMLRVLALDEGGVVSSYEVKPLGKVGVTVSPMGSNDPEGGLKEG